VLVRRFGDSKASEWTYLSARLRSAAKLGGSDMQFGGYIVPRGPTGGVAHGTIGLLKKAIALAGSGASGIDWFEFGPEDMFPVCRVVSCCCAQPWADL
jgi:hypothetical protein